MRKFISMAVLGTFLAFSKSVNAQTGWVYYQNLPSSGSNKIEFTQWLNNQHAMRGLSAVSYDYNLDQHSLRNSYLQSVYGMGHHYMGPARRQNASAVPDYTKIGEAWMQSPGHFEALMDPSITRISVEIWGIYSTFSAY